MQTQSSLTNVHIKFMPGASPEPMLTAKSLMATIFAKNDFRNLQIDDGFQGYSLTLTHEQLTLQPEIAKLENCGWFSSVTYEENSINIQLNDYGSQEFLKIFILH